jgi:hypothetical protein
VAISHAIRDVDPPRDLSEAEGGLLDFLLADPFSGRDALRGQLDGTQVVGECSCGCKTITLAVPEGSEPARLTMRVPVEAQSQLGDEKPIGVLLHAPEGLLEELEVYREDGEALEDVPAPSALIRTVLGQ